LDDKTLKPAIRLEFSSNWLEVTHNRGLIKGSYHKGYRSATTELLAKQQLRKPVDSLKASPTPTKMWQLRKGESVSNQWQLMKKTILLAKTISALKEHCYKEHNIFAPGTIGENNGFDSVFHPNRVLNLASNYGCIPGMIITKRKGAYDTALKTLQDLGYNVIECDEPEVKVKAVDEVRVSAPPRAPTFPLLVSDRYDWVSYGSNEEHIDGMDAYLYMPNSIIQGSYKDTQKPNRTLLDIIGKMFPKTALIQSSSRIVVADRANVKNVMVLLEKRATKLLKNEARLYEMAIFDLVVTSSSLPECLVANSEMAKLLRIKCHSPAQRAKYAEDGALLNAIMNTRWIDLQETNNIRNRIRMEWGRILNKFPDHRVRTEILMRKADIFDKEMLEDKCQSMKRGEVKMFAQKMMRFLRTT